MKTNPRTPAGWTRRRVHGGLMFARKDASAWVEKDASGWWRLFRVKNPITGWGVTPSTYRTWIEAVKAAERL